MDFTGRITCRHSKY